MKDKSKYAKLLDVSKCYILEAKKEFPEMAYYWVCGMSHKDISVVCDISNFFKIKEKLAIAVVRGVIRGVDDIEGLIYENLYDLISKSRDVSYASRKGVLALGRVPLKEGEDKLSYLLHETEGLSWKCVSGILNVEEHRGRAVRTSRAAQNMSNRYKKKIGG